MLSIKIGSVGYWLSEEFQGKGIVLRSVEKLVDYCFTELLLNRIEIKCGTKNYKSQAIAEVKVDLQCSYSYKIIRVQTQFAFEIGRE